MYYVWKYKKYLGNNRSYVKGMADVEKRYKQSNFKGRSGLGGE